jgi:hypothetical protein
MFHTQLSSSRQSLGFNAGSNMKTDVDNLAVTDRKGKII